MRRFQRRDALAAANATLAQSGQWLPLDPQLRRLRHDWRDRRNDDSGPRR